MNEVLGVTFSEVSEGAGRVQGDGILGLLQGVLIEFQLEKAEGAVAGTRQQGFGQ